MSGYASFLSGHQSLAVLKVKYLQVLINTRFTALSNSMTSATYIPKSSVVVSRTGRDYYIIVTSMIVVPFSRGVGARPLYNSYRGVFFLYLLEVKNTSTSGISIYNSHSKIDASSIRAWSGPKP